MRRSRQHRQIADDRGRITRAVSIGERRVSIEDRAVPGHWDGDLLIGDKNSQIAATLVERQTRYVMLVKLDWRGGGTVFVLCFLSFHGSRDHQEIRLADSEVPPSLNIFPKFGG